MSAFKLNVGGRVFGNSTVDILLHDAEAAYGDALDPSDAYRKEQLQIVERLLSSASARGFTKSEILETMLACGERSERVIDMSIEVLNLIGDLGKIEAVAFGWASPRQGAR